VQFRLFKIPQVITNYGTISQQLKKMGILNRVPTPREVADAIIALRRQLLPDFIKIGNVGSFFKNPVVSAKKAQELLKLYPTLPTYPIQENQIKLSAAWLIDHAQLKGFRINDVAVDKHHALVLVNLGQARGEDVKKLAQAIQAIILKQYGIGLEIEPIFVTNAIQIR
jgi:UDP-N-acetylmuramate dehydrogenase